MDGYGKMYKDPKWQISRKIEEYIHNNFNLAHDYGYYFNEIHYVGYRSQKFPTQYNHQEGLVRKHNHNNQIILCTA